MCLAPLLSCQHYPTPSPLPNCSLSPRYWLSVGAQPSDTVARLLGQAGVIPKPPPRLHQGQVKNPDKHKK